MKKIFFLLTVLILIYSQLFAQRVNVKELKGIKKVNFINYQGRNRKRESVRAINIIGERLARGSRRRTSNRRFRYFLKYSIIHAVSQREKNKLSADIFSIDKRARVDHIKNIRRIIASYIHTRYKYSYSNAYVLATFLTYYNAIYRKDLKFFQSKYKKVVLRHLSSRNAGIDVNYKNWPGKTKLIIPLSNLLNEQNPKILDTKEISNEKVIKQLRKRDDKGIKERKDIVKIQKEDLKKQEKQVEKKKEQIIKKENELEKKKEEIKKITDPVKREEKEKELKKEEKQLNKEKKEVKTIEKQLDERKNEIKKDEKLIKEDEKTQDIKKNPEKYSKEINKLEKKVEEQKKTIDQKEKIIKEQKKEIAEKKEKNISEDRFYYLKRLEYTPGGHYNNEMIIIDADLRRVVLKSPLKTISGKNFGIVRNGVLVIARRSKQSKVHNLVLLNKKTLKALSVSRQNVFWRTFIEVRGRSVYVLVQENGQNYLARFNEKLEMTAKSDKPLYLDTTVSFYKNFIYLSSPDKRILVLKKEDLSFVQLIRP